MADFTFNVAKGKVAYYAGLPTGGDTLIALMLKTASIEADSAMKDRTTLASSGTGLLNTGGGGSTEATDASYARKTLTSVSVTIDNTNDWVIATGTIPTWTALAGAALSKTVIAYKPNGGSDSTSVPLTGHDTATTPDGTDFTLTVPASGFCKIT